MTSTKITMPNAIHEIVHMSMNKAEKIKISKITMFTFLNF